jgi:hypothetical protein
MIRRNASPSPREKACAIYAAVVLWHEYLLSDEERRHELKRLTRALLRTTDAELKQIEHRKVDAWPKGWKEA